MSNPSHVVKTVTSKADGLKIYAEAIGDPAKPAVVYIHGNSTSSGVWDNQFFDKDLSSNFYQVRFDLRGHGLSETPEDSPTCFDNEQQASDVAAVLEAFNIKKPVFVSWSYGALIPSDYMSVHGYESVRAVAVINGVTGPPQDVMKFFIMGGNPAFNDNSDATKQHEAYGRFIKSLTAKPLSREWTLRLRGMLTETATSTRQWIWKRKKDWSVYMGEASKHVPKLVMFGSEDGMNSLAFIDYIKTKWDPSLLTIKFTQGAGHASFLEKPAETNVALAEWLNSLP